MVKLHVDIGPAPPDEPCEQAGPDYHAKKAIGECNRYIKLIRQVVGIEPEGARLVVKTFVSGNNVYHEVVCEYDPNKPETLDYALKCESDGPATWTDTTKR